MNFAALSTTQIIIIVAVAAVVVLVGIGIWQSVRKRHTAKLRTQFGATEYTRAVSEGGSQQKAEAALNARATRVEKLHITRSAPAIAHASSNPGPKSRPASWMAREAPSATLTSFSPM